MRLSQFGLVGLVGCGFDWILSRRWRRLSLCFLPIIIAISTVGLVAAGGWKDKYKLAEVYLEAANQEVTDWEEQWEGKSVEEDVASGKAQPKKIPAAAEMLFRRVQQLHQNDSRSVFFVALSYIQRGAVQQGLTMLARIAPTDRVGYPPAHAYLAEQILLRPISLKEVPIARHHAQAALSYRQISPQLLAMISHFFARVNEPGSSVDAMKAAAKLDPKFNLLLAQLPIKDELYQADLKEGLVKGKLYFEEKLAANPHDTAARLMLADTHRVMGDLVSAEQVIVDGLKLGETQVLKSALSEIYRQVFVKSAVFKDNQWSGDIELLERAFRLDPNNLLIFEEVAKLARVAGSAPNEELMVQLRKNLAEGRATSVTHMWIAEHYLITNQFAKAIPHLEQAVNRDPTSSRNWNNLAYCLADVDPSRLADALKDVDQAIALAPKVPDYHDTRGMILMKMNKPGDAITSFERALECVRKSGGAFGPQPGYHERLAQAYAAVGDQAMATTHRDQATAVQKALEQAQPPAQN